LQLEEIVAITTVQNNRSQAVMERLGMKRIAQEFMHPAVPIGHHLQRHCLYKIVKNEWELSA
jgi:RimJ/RimL family protein N-acetyltransferase